jgi:hypothetical protein
MLTRLGLIAALLVAASPAFSQDCPLTTTANTVLRQAPGPAFAQIGTIPARAAIAVSMCFDRGAYCAVQAGDARGFVSGDLVVTPGGQTLKALETARWAKIDADEPAGPPAYDRCNIVVWGDSLSAGTFGPNLARLLNRDVSMQGVPGEDGPRIAARMLPDTKHDGRIAVIWDRHWSHESVAQYMEELAPLVEKAQRTATAYIVVSDIPDVDGTTDVTAEADAAETTAINAALSAKYAANYLDLTGVLADPSLHTDGLHLSPSGMDAVAGAIAGYITRRGW